MVFLNVDNHSDLWNDKTNFLLCFTRTWRAHMIRAPSLLPLNSKRRISRRCLFFVLDTPHLLCSTNITEILQIVKIPYKSYTETQYLAHQMTNENELLTPLGLLWRNETLPIYVCINPIYIKMNSALSNSEIHKCKMY